MTLCDGSQIKSVSRCAAPQRHPAIYRLGCNEPTGHRKSVAKAGRIAS